jgi:hypothetical protein
VLCSLAEGLNQLVLEVAQGALHLRHIEWVEIEQSKARARRENERFQRKGRRTISDRIWVFHDAVAPRTKNNFRWRIEWALGTGILGFLLVGVGVVRRDHLGRRARGSNDLP